MSLLRKMRMDYEQYCRICKEAGITPWNSLMVFGKNKKPNYYDHWKDLIKEGKLTEEPTGRG